MPPPAAEASQKVSCERCMVWPLLYRSRAAGASGKEEEANLAEKPAACAKVTELREKCGKTKKRTKMPMRRKRKNLRMIVQMRKPSGKTGIKHGNTTVEDC